MEQNIHDKVTAGIELDTTEIFFRQIRNAEKKLTKKAKKQRKNFIAWSYNDDNEGEE